MASETDWLANKVTFAHDADGNPTGQDNNVSTSNPNGTSATTFTYDNADVNTQPRPHWPRPAAGTETLTQSFSGTGGSRNPDGQLTQYQYLLHRVVLGADLLPAQLQLRPGRPGRLPGQRHPRRQPQQLRLRPLRGPHHHLLPRQRRATSTPTPRPSTTPAK